LTYCAFDIDGTLYDCGPIILEAFQEGARRFAADAGTPLRVPTREDILRVVGLPTDEMFYRLYPALSTAENDRLNFISTECLSAMVRKRGGILFDGVRETLEELDGRDVRMLVASNGKPRYIEAILETYDLVRFFSGPLVMVNGDIKNKTDIVRYYLDNVTGGDMLIMVGDRASDRAAARENGVPFIGCAFGHAGDEEIAGERWIARRFSDIPRLVREIERHGNG